MTLSVRRDGEKVADQRDLSSAEIREVGDEAYAMYIRCLNELKRRGEW